MPSTLPIAEAELDPEILVEPPVAVVDARSRSKTRYRRAGLAALSSIFAKLIVLVTTIVTVPLTFRYLGAERYGMWMTITSAVLFLGFADLGVGNGVTAAVAEANGRDDVLLARRQVSCGFFLLLALAGLIALLLIPALHFVPWATFYGVHSWVATREAAPATATLILCTAANMPLGTVLRVQAGYQQGYRSELWNAAGNALALVGILLVTRFNGGVPALVLAAAGVPALVTGLNWLTEFFWRRPYLRPSLALFERGSALRLASVGGLFFVQQCFGLIYYVSDNMVIARTMGAQYVAQYAVLARIFSVGLIAQYLMTPLWPAIGEALARRDLDWTRGVIRRALGVSVGASLLCGMALLAVSGTLMHRWAGVPLRGVDPLRIGFALWVVVVGYVACMNAILNQPGMMRRHLVWFGAASMISLALKIVAAQHGSLTGVIWATVLTFAVVYVGPTLRLALCSDLGAGGTA